MGVKLRGRLPEGNGLTDKLGDELAANPRPILIVATLQPDDVTKHLDTGTLTTSMEIIELEVLGDSDEETARDMLRRIREDRTGQAALMDLPGGSTGDPAEYQRQLELARKEEAALLEEKADKLGPGPKRDKLEADAEAFRSGARDEEVAAKHNLIPAFTEPAEGDD